VNIAFDAKRAYLNLTGLGNYARTLMTGMANNHPENNYFLYTPFVEKIKFHLDMVSHDNVKVIAPDSTQIVPGYHAFWRTYLMASSFRKNEIDLYHGLTNELPRFTFRSKARMLVTLHDLIFIRYPEYYPFVDQKMFYSKSRHACSRADRIIAISEQTKRDIIEFFKTDPAKIDVVYQSCNPVYYKDYSSDEVEEARRLFDLPNEFLLNVGTIEPRKNLITLLKALTLTKNPIPLVVIGKKRKHFEELLKFINKEKIFARVMFRENISNDMLPLVYRASSAFVFPSMFEGFGIPIIEALFSGVPVITSTGSCFDEAGGPGTVYVSPQDEQQMAHEIDRVLSDTALRKQMIQTGLEHVQQFHIDKVIENTWKVYTSMQ
jgi:glycosyltransferase involved in cell wall biosynthesis